MLAWVATFVGLRTGVRLSASNEYYAVRNDRNRSVDYMGQSMWSDLKLLNLPSELPELSHREFQATCAPRPENRVFCSRTLNMRSIKCLCYDMDYTIVNYNWRKWEELAYECTKSVLAGFGFPVDDLKFDDPDLVCRGLVIDSELGNFLKIDRHGYVRRAMHGSTRLSESQIDSVYGRMMIDLRHSRFSFLNTLFSVSEGVLYSQLVQKLDSGALFRDAVEPFDPSKVTSYATLYRAVSKALSRAHTHSSSSLKAKVLEDPSQFATREPEKLRAMLSDQRRAGKKIALITNSDWSYTNTMMEYVVDGQWRDYFDVVFASARKPSFFTPDRLPCYEILEDDRGAPLLKETMEPRLNGVYCGGSARLVEKLFDVSADELLYVGDHVFVDVNSVKASMRWRTALVVQELEPEIAAFRAEHLEKTRLDALFKRKDEVSARLNHLRCLLARYDNGDDDVIHDPAKATACRQHIAAHLSSIRALDAQIAPRVRHDGAAFNRHWGFMSRAGGDKSHLQRQIEKYADIYTASVTNLHDYTPYHYWRASAQALAHEPSDDDYSDEDDRYC